MLQQLVRAAAQASHPHHATTTCDVAVLSLCGAEAHIFSGSTCLILTWLFVALGPLVWLDQSGLKDTAARDVRSSRQLQY
jgi:hypothetical protein